MIKGFKFGHSHTACVICSCPWDVLTCILGVPLTARFSFDDWNLEEMAEQLGKMVEHPNQSQPNHGARADGGPCTNQIRTIFPFSTIFYMLCGVGCVANIFQT